MSQFHSTLQNVGMNYAGLKFVYKGDSVFRSISSAL